MVETAMLPLRALVEAHREEIKAVAARHRGTGIAIVGSVARGDESAESDIDFLVDLEPGASLFDLGRMLVELRDLLDRRVDLVDSGVLLPRDADIRHDAVRL